jgi:membrane associated rhomboid family serine protease/Flp pilus assembly protein TadD
MSGAGNPISEKFSNSVGSRRKPPAATFSLIAFNLAVFLLMAVSSGHWLKFSGGQVLQWGGNYGPLTMEGHWWRLVSTMFVHIGLFHLAVNMWALYELGGLAEQIYGSVPTLVMYLLTGAAGSIASLARNPTIVSAGASGAIFGLAGVLIVTLALRRLAVRSGELTIVLASLLAFAGYNLSYGFLKGGIDNGAHLGGLTSGLLIGVALAAGHTQGRWRRESAVYAAAVLVLAAGYATVRKTRTGTIAIEGARQALQLNDPDAVIRRLSKVPSLNHNPDALSLLATAYGAKRQNAEAEKYYRRCLQLEPRNGPAHRGLGVLLAATGRVQEASQELRQAAALEPNVPGTWLQLGLVLQKLSQHAQAADALKRATALNPDLAPAQFALGISQMNLRQYEAAITSFEKTTQLIPNNYEAQIWLANAYQAAGHSNEASAAYVRAIQLRPRPLRRPQSVH